MLIGVFPTRAGTWINQLKCPFSIPSSTDNKISNWTGCLLWSGDISNNSSLFFHHRNRVRAARDNLFLSIFSGRGLGFFIFFISTILRAQSSPVWVVEELSFHVVSGEGGFHFHGFFLISNSGCIKSLYHSTWYLPCSSSRYLIAASGWKGRFSLFKVKIALWIASWARTGNPIFESETICRTRSLESVFPSECLAATASNVILSPVSNQ